MSTLRSLELDDVALHACSFTRKEGDANEPGQVKNHGQFAVDTDGPRILFSVKSDMLDTSDEEIATVEVSFMLSYKSEVAVSEEELAEYATDAGVFQVHPYFRQFLASTCAQAGLPGLILPVLVHPSVSDDDSLRQADE